jgi:hypothetical protein
MPRAQKIFSRASLGTRAIGSSALVQSIEARFGWSRNVIVVHLFCMCYVQNRVGAFMLTVLARLTPRKTKNNVFYFTLVVQ